MFSGIIADMGVIMRAEHRDGGMRLSVETRSLGLDDVQIGDSIAVNGVCLTVIEKRDHQFAVDVSSETLNCTTGLNTQGVSVNLEKALRLSDRINGHLVSGHVDGVGVVIQRAAAGENCLLTVRGPQALGKYLAVKGSVTINGVSLTINRVDGCEFSVNLIPHTLQMTTLKALVPGSPVNLEVDLLARYVERMLAVDHSSG